MILLPTTIVAIVTWCAPSGGPVSSASLARLALARVGIMLPKQNVYANIVLVANKPEYKPTVMVDPLLADGWGIAIRPPGKGGHFWINNTATGTTTTYVGDVGGSTLYQDELKVVYIPTSRLYESMPANEKVSEPTGIVYSDWNPKDYVIKGTVKDAAGERAVVAGAKFVFCSLDGNITAWTTGMESAVSVYDDSVNGAMYTGIASTEKPAGGNRLFIADFGLEKIVVLDGEFKPVPLAAGAFVEPKLPSRMFSAWNMQWLNAAEGGKLYVTWAYQGDDPGEEDQLPGYGFVSAFDENGKHLQSLEYGTWLNAPWGLAIAPDNFGAMSGRLLVANFADGVIHAYDRVSGKYIDFLRGIDGKPVLVEGAWGLLFGNGVSLGETNHMYYAAGPNIELDGTFGKLVPLDP